MVCNRFECSHEASPRLGRTSFVALMFVTAPLAALARGDCTHVNSISLIQAHARSLAAPKQLILNTSVGAIKALEWGDQGSKRLALSIHGMCPDSPMFEYQWAGPAIAAQGYRVIAPDFCSNPAAKPFVIVENEIHQVLLDILEEVGAEFYQLVLGKSWGGWASGTFSDKYPAKVRSLIWICPYLYGAGDLHISCPSALFWSEDDDRVSIDGSPQAQNFLKDQRFFCKATSGGHRVLEEYTSSIAKFAQSPSVERSGHDMQSCPA